MKIKKLLAGGLAAITAGATMALGVFGAGLGDYVKVSDSTLSSPMIVIGAPSAPSADFAMDVIGAADIAAAVAGYATTTEVIPGAAGVPSVSGGTLLTSDLNKTYLGQSFNLVKSAITESELPTLLATGTFTDMNASEISYQQQIEPGSGLVVNYGTTTDFTEPYLYTTFGSGKTYNVTVLFLGGLDTSAVSSDYRITLFGNEFTFGPASTQAPNKLTLYSSTGAQTVTLSVGDEQTVTVDGVDYTIKMLGYTNTPGVVLQINGQSTTPTEWVEGGTYTLPGSTTKVLVNDVTVLQQGGAQGGTVTASCQLFIGTNKLVFQDGLPVYKNDVALTNTLVDIDNSSTKITKLEVQIAPDIDYNLKDGDTFTDPVFGTFKWTISGMTPGFTDASREKITLERDGANRVKLTFTNKDGNENSVDILYGSGSTFTQTVDGTHNFVTTQINQSQASPYNIGVGDYFVVSKDKRTRILKYDTYYPSTDPGKQYVQFTDIGSGVSYKVYYNTDSFLRIGMQSHNVSYNATTHKVAVDLTGNCPGFTCNATVTLYTQEEAAINIDNPYITITESPLYTLSGSNEPTGSTINITASYSAANGVTFSTNATTYQVGTSYEYKGVTNYGTYLDLTGDSVGTKKVEIYYPGKRPAYVNVAVGSDPQVVVSGGTGGTYEKAVKITTPVAKLASEVDTSALTSDLILIGGPCANSLVATLLSAEDITCDNWNYTKGIIKEIENAFDSGHKALIVAGTTGSDTRELAAMVMQGTTCYEDGPC